MIVRVGVLTARTCAVGMLLVVGGSRIARAQQAAQQRATIVVRGAVTSRGDGGAVPLAEVQLVRTGGRTYSNENGHFSITAAGGDTLAVRALGFRQRRVAVVGDSMHVVLEPLPTVLPVFTTTIGQRTVRASESPRSVTVVDQRALSAAAAVAVNQALRNVPGLQELASPPAKTSIAIRGFDDSRVLVLVDGEPVSGSLVESRDIGRLSTLATERIEVTKGPSSVEFGSDALGGVINLVQAAPADQLTVDALVRTGELGRQEANAGISSTVGAVGYRVSGAWRLSDRVTGFNAAGSTFNRVYDLRGDFRYALGTAWTIRLDGLASQERQRFPVDAQFNGFIDNRGAQGFIEAFGALLGGSFRARAFAQRFAYEYRQARGTLPIQGSADSLRQHERQGRYLMSYTRMLGAHAIDVGVQRSVRTLIAPDKVDGDSARETLSEVFARDQWSIGPVSLTAGARFSSSDLWGSSTNPSVGATWQTHESLRLRANVARGFRAPSFKEIRYTFFNVSGGYTLIGNPDLQPESSISGAVGGTWAPSSTFSVDVEGYRNNVDGLIDWRFQGNNPGGYQTYANVNIASARTEGVETAFRLSSHGAQYALGYDYLRARDLETGLPLSRRATHTARFTAGREWSVRRGLNTDLSVRYTGKAPLIGTPSGTPAPGTISTEAGIIGWQGAFTSVDAQVRLMLTNMAELSAGVNNAFDQHPALWTPAFARQVYVGARMRWSQGRGGEGRNSKDAPSDAGASAK